MNGNITTEDRSQQALDLAILAGTIQLKNGAEIHRVQDTVEWILQSLDVRNYNVYVISNGIFASVNETEPKPLNAVRHIPTISFHLGRIVAVNELSREIAVAGNTCDIGAMHIRMKEADALPYADNRLRLVSCAAACASFSWLLGGGVLDSFAALIAGFFLQLFLFWGAKIKMSRFITNIVGAALVTLLSQIILKLGIGNSLDFIIIGGIIPLVPGVLLVSSIRELFNSNYLSGIIHLIDALLIATSIAVGVGVALRFWEWGIVPLI